MYHGQMMLQSGRDWWRSGWLGPRWYQYYPSWVNGFDAADFGNWVLHGLQGQTEWYRNTTDYLYGDSSATIGAGSPGAGTQHYRGMKAQHGLNLTQYIVEVWIKTGTLTQPPVCQRQRFFLGLGPVTYYIGVIVVEHECSGAWNEPWTHYRIIFYQDPVTLHRMAQVFRWDGTSWVLVRTYDSGGVGNWSGFDYVYIRAEATTGGQITCGLDQLEMYAKYM